MLSLEIQKLYRRNLFSILTFLSQSKRRYAHYRDRAYKNISLYPERIKSHPEVLLYTVC